MRYSFLSNGLIGAVLLSVIFSGCSKKAEVVLPPVKVNVVKAVKTDVPMYEEFVAQVYGQSDVDIRTRVEGWVTDMNFKEGSHVKKGQLLYVIDDIEYKNRLDRQKSELTRAKTELVRANSELSRVKPLTEQKALSQKDLDNAQANYDAAAAHVESTQASLENAKVELGYTRVHAPFDGVVGMSNVRIGDYVSRMGTSSVLTTISSVGGVRVRFQISEREYLRIAQLSPEEINAAKKNVQLVMADGSIYDQPGEINFADREIDPRTGTLTIEATFPNSKGLLRPGLFVKARVLMSTYPSAVMIPQRAVFQLQHLSQVYLLTDSSTLKASSVEPGPKVGDGWIIKKGLKPGDRVAIVGTANLTPNAKVETIEMKWPEEKQQ
jgi:membrane fusion protein, multidrug efflux system